MPKLYSIPAILLMAFGVAGCVEGDYYHTSVGQAPTEVTSGYNRDYQTSSRHQIADSGYHTSSGDQQYQQEQSGYYTN